MSERRTAWLLTAALGVGVAALIVPYQQRALDQERRNDDQADQLAVQDQWNDKQALVIARLEEQNRRLEELVERQEAERQASELEACLARNGAQRTARSDVQAALDGTLEVFRLSPHGDITVAMVEELVRPRLSTPAVDADCDADGVPAVDDPGDYPS